ncbi:hypothetical protein MATL_G00159420 [Megalops atlanticus]|uniref:Ig-like domain-containing protein n=1 Tax=Megalops atlanticus TaxID=7932 RepID=A0A9D3T8W2_MEGAT|nr:hypothetical protein MATL_G00159420 [Megalops atlanticus]
MATKIAIMTALGAGCSVAAVPLVLGGIGFTAAGIAGGSYAAGMMSAAATANGGGVAAGSLVAVLQSIDKYSFRWISLDFGSQSTMGPKLTFLLTVLTAIFKSAGNDPSDLVPVKVGGRAVLPCNVSKFVDSKTESGSINIVWKTNEGHVCKFFEGKSEAYNGYSNRTTISSEKIREGYLIIDDTNFSDEADYFCFVEKNGKPLEYVSTVRLKVEGRSENYNRSHGRNFSLPLYSNKVIVEFKGEAANSSMVTVCQVEGDRVIHPGQGYHGRLAVMNRHLILWNLTTSDQGTYTEKDNKTGRAMVNITVTIMAPPVGTPTLDRTTIIIISCSGIALLLFGSGICIHQMIAKQRMRKRETEALEGINGVPLLSRPPPDSVKEAPLPHQPEDKKLKLMN